MNERRAERQCWRPGDRSPGFLIFIVIVALVSMLIGSCSEAVAKERTKAPVVKPFGEVLKQTGWIDYDYADDVMIVYCVDGGSLTLQCLVGVLVEKKWVFGVAPIQATRIET